MNDGEAMGMLAALKDYHNQTDKENQTTILRLREELEFEKVRARNLETKLKVSESRTEEVQRRVKVLRYNWSDDPSESGVSVPNWIPPSEVSMFFPGSVGNPDNNDA